VDHQLFGGQSATRPYHQAQDPKFRVRQTAKEQILPIHHKELPREKTQQVAKSLKVYPSFQSFQKSRCSVEMNGRATFAQIFSERWELSERATSQLASLESQTHPNLLLFLASFVVKKEEEESPLRNPHTYDRSFPFLDRDDDNTDCKIHSTLMKIRPIWVEKTLDSSIQEDWPLGCKKRRLLVLRKKEW